MRLAAVNNQIIGAELAVPIYLPNGIIFVNKGSILSEKTISRIKGMGIDIIYISDGNDDVAFEEVLPTPVRFKIVKTLEQAFTDVSKKEVLDQKVILNTVREILNNINVSENSFLLNNTGKKDMIADLCQHSLNVTILSAIIGIKKGYDSKKLESLAAGALLHDIGKLFTEGKDHAKKGYDFVRNANLFNPTSTICIYEHHEWEDGSGYPEGIKGSKIYEFAKIVSICNEYVNLYMEQNMMPSEAIEIIMAKTFKQFDPAVYKDFVQSIYCYPNGATVKLSNGQGGIVIMQNKDFPSRPIVCTYDNGVPSHTYNLIEETTLFIDKIVL